MNKPDSSTLNRNNTAAFLEDIFERRGGEEYLGKPVTMAQHMPQSATIAEQNGQPEIIIVSALLHDIGHFTSEFGMFQMGDTEDRFNEDAGGEVPKDFFPTLVIDWVRYHVAAKRHLCAARPAYFERPSVASIHSLTPQGGPMSDDEVQEFEKSPNLKGIIAVRFLDDAGKHRDMNTPPFANFALIVQRVVDRDHNPEQPG